MGLRRVFLNFLLVQCVFWMIQIGGCTTEQVSPPAPPTVPEYTKVPHPVGSDLGDLAAIFTDPTAPEDPEFSKECDQSFKKLKGLTQSVTELTEGVRELVSRDPVKYHWCFYSKMFALEKDIKQDTFLDERQKKILEYYEFLVPVARCFSTEFHDTRYLRFATDRYKRLSEWVFFRKLDLTPSGTVELVRPENPFGLYRKSGETYSILDKYHITETPMSPEVIPIQPMVSGSTQKLEGGSVTSPNTAVPSTAQPLTSAVPSKSEKDSAVPVPTESSPVSSTSSPSSQKSGTESSVPPPDVSSSENSASDLKITPGDVEKMADPN